MTGIDSVYVFWQPEPYSGRYDVYTHYFARDRNEPLCSVRREGRLWIATARPDGDILHGEPAYVAKRREAAVAAFIAGMRR